MLDPSEAPRIIEALKDAIEQNRQEALNLEAGLDLLESKEGYLEQKLEAFDSIADLAVKLLESLMQLNERKNELENGNQGLRQDLCDICLINNDLQDKVFEKEKEVEQVQKELKGAMRRIEKLQKQMKQSPQKASENFEKFSGFYSLSQDRQSVILPENLEGITLVESRIEAYPDQRNYDEICEMKVQIQELKATITRLSAVINFMEERQELRRQEDELRQLEIQQKQRQAQIQNCLPKFENPAQHPMCSQYKQQEQVMRTLAYSRSSQSLAEDIVDLDNDDKVSEQSIRKRIQFLRAESAPSFGSFIDGHFEIEISTERQKQQKQLIQVKRLDTIPIKIEQHSLKRVKSEPTLFQKGVQTFGDKLSEAHEWLKRKIVSERVDQSLQRQKFLFIF